MLTLPTESLERLKQFIDYNEVTGRLHWKVANSNRVKIGQECGCVSGATGYRVVRHDNVLLATHHIVWFLCKEVWPTTPLDHINRNKLDNRIENLREASLQQNNYNVAKKNINYTSRYKGVWLDRHGKPRARVYKDGNRFELGAFSNEEEAAKAYDKLARELFGEFAKLNFEVIND